jgi:hypothetical protein
MLRRDYSWEIRGHVLTLCDREHTSEDESEGAIDAKGRGEPGAFVGS